MIKLDLIALSEQVLAILKHSLIKVRQNSPINGRSWLQLGICLKALLISTDSSIGNTGRIR